jgi:HD-GYP domain-containing protein (c-di-GMP phosphodiesterase class II)
LVTIYIEQFSRAMGYSKERRKRLILAAKYHDIGKIAIEERILNSSKGLTPYEYNRMKQHASIGYRILSLIDDYKDIALFVYQHHENYDGKGYPNQLKGKEILEEARMLKIVDAYDSMTNDYSYRKSISKKEAIKELIRCKGKDFDPDLVDVFVSIV